MITSFFSLQVVLRILGKSSGMRTCKDCNCTVCTEAFLWRKVMFPRLIVFQIYLTLFFIMWSIYMWTSSISNVFFFKSPMQTKVMVLHEFFVGQYRFICIFIHLMYKNITHIQLTCSNIIFFSSNNIEQFVIVGM